MQQVAKNANNGGDIYKGKFSSTLASSQRLQKKGKIDDAQVLMNTSSFFSIAVIMLFKVYISVSARAVIAQFCRLQLSFTAIYSPVNIKRLINVRTFN